VEIPSFYFFADMFGVFSIYRFTDESVWKLWWLWWQKSAIQIILAEIYYLDLTRYLSWQVDLIFCLSRLVAIIMLTFH